jgi:hypothetical protein
VEKWQDPTEDEPGGQNPNGEDLGDSHVQLLSRKLTRSVGRACGASTGPCRFAALQRGSQRLDALESANVEDMLERAVAAMSDRKNP